MVMDGWQIATGVLAIALVVVSVQSGTVEVNLGDGEWGSALGNDVTDASDPTPTPAMAEERETDTPAPVTTVALVDFKRIHLERRVAEIVNDRREDRGLSPLNYDAKLARVARYHSEDMAENGYFSHTSPNGETVSDRYAKFDYDCEVEISSTQVATGGENIFQTWYKTRIQDGYGDGYYTGFDELARAIVHGWMQSDRHRGTILDSKWKRQGIGVGLVEIGGDVQVLVTQNFC
jgi:uncharacterized protein YkwD